MRQPSERKGVLRKLNMEGRILTSPGRPDKAALPRPVETRVHHGDHTH